MIPFELKGQKFLMPSSYHELSLGQYLAIRDLKSHELAGMLSILSGLSVDTWNAARLSDQELALVNAALQWMNDMQPELWKLPKFLNIGEKRVKVPSDITILPLGAKMYFEMKVLPLCNSYTDEAGQAHITGFKMEAIPYAIAPYMQHGYNEGGKFDADNLEEIEKMLLDCPVTDTYAVASFFLTRWARCEARRLQSPMIKTKTRLQPELRVLTPSEI